MSGLGPNFMKILQFILKVSRGKLGLKLRLSNALGFSI
jgi:hypothetical protein